MLNSKPYGDNGKDTKSYRMQNAFETQTYIDEQTLNQLIDYCKKNNTFAPLIRNLGRCFSSREYLVRSFLMKRSKSGDANRRTTLTLNSKVFNKEDFRALDEDEKDRDESGESKNLIKNE